MAPDGTRETSRPNRPGDISLSMGVVAFLFSFVPVMGDVVAAVAGPLALVLGAIGVRRSERGVATNFGPSLIGATLGALAILVVALMFAVTR
ncbi:hypothetical protein G4Z16_16400 [Streptomyces bathyalis]|uniref:DUF4190 domain-containing protein n=1 Tax=Streptomyces bathyalis TaxID=2710756 RepID=A0A7T1T7A7_9ACTN|nr:hypothetical protein [Streptomyces bathyalis]QPP07715.1 hypothetical protein G4Z16_16400 [Streptomyces bathyalis]